MRKLLTYSLIMLSITGIITNTILFNCIIANDKIYSSNLRYDFLQLRRNTTNLLNNYNILFGQDEDLQKEFDNILTTYLNLNDDYNQLEILIGELTEFHNDLSNQLDDYYYTLSLQTLPEQYNVFAEKVRRFYLPAYCDDSNSEEEYYLSYAEYSRDVVLHDSQQENSFQAVSNALSPILKYSSDTMRFANYMFNSILDDRIDHWDRNRLIGNEFEKISSINRNCIVDIFYKSDSEITEGREELIYDYIRFPVETAYTAEGDCEDQAILEAAYLESCGFETALALIHVQDHPIYDKLYHAALLVHIENTEEFATNYPEMQLWNLGEIDPYLDKTWCWLDPTWDTDFGSYPLWLEAYYFLDLRVPSDIFTFTICDIDGGII